MRALMSVEIEAPPEKVWPYLVEPVKTMQWHTLKKFEYTSEKPGPGSTFYWEEEVRGKVYATHFRTTEWLENRVFAYEMTSADYFKSCTERWELGVTPTGCRFSWDHHAHAGEMVMFLHDVIEFPYGPFGKVVSWFLEWMARTLSQEILENLKRLAEA
ncbi:MAG: SRPBCC family protein [Thermoplasmata archaeon]